MSQKKANRVLGIVVALIAIVAVIAVLTVKEPVAQLDKDSPEGAVQQYLSSITDRDFVQAMTYLASDTKCTIEDFDRAYIQDSLRIGLSDTTSTESTATVKVKSGVFEWRPFRQYFWRDSNFQTHQR